jgi:hypothetical protein
VKAQQANCLYLAVEEEEKQEEGEKKKKTTQDGMKSRQTSGNTFYHAVQNLCLPGCYINTSRLKYSETNKVWYPCTSAICHSWQQFYEQAKLF